LAKAIHGVKRMDDRMNQAVITRARSVTDNLHVNRQEQDMGQEKMSSENLAILGFIGGALVGALVVALTTPKSGPDLRKDLKALGRRAKDKADALGGQAAAVWSKALDRTGKSVDDLKRDVHEIADDLKRGLHEVSLDF
jgi:gas vesicle protein